MKLPDHLAGLWGISICAWGLFAFYISFRIERFIVRRYEQETDLLNTIFFKEHASFTRGIPGFFSSAMYTSHLLMCVWGWWFYKNKKVFRDIEDPTYVVQNFSTKEIRCAKWFAISCAVIGNHIIAYLIFRSIWPETFD